MQPRLTRSPTEQMLAGVCGGLAEYFNIDPVIVRLIFVLVTLTSGIGLPVYVLLWIIMPKDATSAKPSIEEGAKQFSREIAQLGHTISQETSRISREVMVGQRQGGASQPRTGVPGETAPPPADFRFDPQTGAPLGPDPATGQTVNLVPPPAELPASVQPAAQRRGRSWNTLGAVLIVVGGLVFLEQFGVDMSLIFPALLIVAGVVLLRRKR